MQAHEGGHHARVEVLSRLAFDGRKPALRIPGLLVRPFRDERVVHVRHGDDARGERDLLALLPVRIPGAVPALVMFARDSAPGREELRLPEHRLAIDAVLLHDVELINRELVRRAKDVVRRLDLSDVMEHARVAETLYR